MAKKKVKKTKPEVCNSETEIARVENLIALLTDNITDVNKRIDRIVIAIDKSKSVRNL